MSIVLIIIGIGLIILPYAWILAALMFSANHFLYMSMGLLLAWMVASCTARGRKVVPRLVLTEITVLFLLVWLLRDVNLLLTDFAKVIGITNGLGVLIIFVARIIDLKHEDDKSEAKEANTNEQLASDGVKVVKKKSTALGFFDYDEYV